MQTPAKYENGGAAGNAGTDEEINTSPPEQSYGAGMPSSTPPPGPSQSRVQGTKQFAKPMKIQKKRFVMAAPDRQEHIPNLSQGQSNNQYLNTPNTGPGGANYPQGGDGRDNSANRMNNNASRNSL